MVVTLPAQEWLELAITIHTLILRWFMLAVAIVFGLGIVFTYVARAQAPTVWTNAANIASVDGKVKILENRYSDLAEVKIELQSVRERMVISETTSKETGRKVDEIYADRKWLVFAIFGVLINEAMKRLKFRAPPPD